MNKSHTMAALIQGTGHWPWSSFCPSFRGSGRESALRLTLSLIEIDRQCQFRRQSEFHSSGTDKATVGKALGDHSDSRIAKDVDHDGFLSLDELKLRNKINDQAVKGADLNGDGIVSMKEALLTTLNSSSNQHFDTLEAADDVDINSTPSEIYAKYRAELLKNHPFSVK